MFNESRIYIAGHTGLLGTALVKKLREAGYANLIMRPHAQLELTDKKAVFAFFAAEKPEHVFLAAGKVGGIVGNKTRPAEFLHVNLAIQDNLFEAAPQFAVKTLVFYGSSCTYPRNCPQPMKEEYFLTGPVESTSEAYAAAKIAGIMACRSYNFQYQTTRFLALVPNSMYGPGDNFDLENSHVLSALIRKFHEAKLKAEKKVTLWGSGRPQREFIFSEDVAVASIFAVRHLDKLANEHYNLGTGTDYAIKELAQIIAGIVGYEGEIVWDTQKPDGTPRKLLDSSKFLNLGWKPATKLEAGLKFTYEWYCRQTAL